MNIDMEYKKGILFVRLDGILNVKTSCIFEDALNRIVNKAGIRYILINFEKLYEIDKVGISSIINSYNKFLKNSGKLMICGYNDVLRMKIEESELLKYASPTNDEISAFNLVNI
ncbi:MAG: STAS domain-containing protein [Bacilli bacterium]